MKINGTVTSLEKQKDGSVKEVSKNGIDVNFDRILSVKLYRSYNNSKAKEPEYMEFRYCPLDRSHQYEAKMDVEIQYRPNSGKINTKPGFSAVVKLYNPGQDVINMLLHQTAKDSKFNFDQSLNNKCYIIINAGYWKHETEPVGISNILKGESSASVEARNCDWHELFCGYVNTSARYRNGADEIVEMYCHNINQNITSSSPWRSVVTNAIKNNKPESQILEMLYGEFKDIVANSGGDRSLDATLQRVMKRHAPYRASGYRQGGIPIDMSFSNASDQSVELTDDIRERGDWFKIRYINQPNTTDYSSVPFDNNLYDEAKKKRPFNFINPPADVRDEPTLLSVIDKALQSSGLNIRRVNNIVYQNGFAYLYLYRPTGGTEALKSGRLGPGEVVTIWNFQNFLSAPIVDGAGRFSVKMMFNPECKAGRFLKLEWGKNTKTMGALSETIGVGVSSQLGFAFPTLQGGLYQAQVAALTKNQGYLFDGYYRMINVTHKLSTHGNEWTTTVRTAPGLGEPK